MKALNLVSMIIFVFAISSAMNAQAELQSKGTKMIGVVSSGEIDWPLLEKDLKSKESIEPAFFMMGIALDSAAKSLGKFQQVPTYRVTHLMKNILATFRENINETNEEIVQKIHAQMTKDCDVTSSTSPCTFQIRIKSADWIQPLPNLKAPAKAEDLERYGAAYVRDHFPELKEKVKELDLKGETIFMGSVIKREKPEIAMTEAEKTELEEQFVQTYKKILQDKYFVKTKMGWFWIESLDDKIKSNPWSDLTIRAKTVPNTYQGLVTVIKEGLNRYYLRQKREEIFWAYLAMHDNQSIKMTQDLLDKSFFVWSGPQAEEKPSYEQIKKSMMDWIQNLQKEKTEVVARFALLQNIMARLESRESLY